jgi:pimeloyl-ACP methyl ester carboxylesterase
MSIKGKTLHINGIDLNVHIEGEGPVVLLLHGFPDSNALWRGVIPALVGAGYQVIAPDQRGFGKSYAPDGVKNYRIETIANDAIALLDMFDIPKAHLVAHDWGAIIGWDLAGRHGDRFFSYTALSVGHPAAYVKAGWEQKRKAWYTVFFQLRGVVEVIFQMRNWAVFRRFVRHHPETEHWIEDLSRPGRFTAALNWYRANLLKLYAADFARVGIPVMGVWSSDDLALAKDQMLNSGELVDNSFRYEQIDNCGHWIPLDEPEAVAELILNFLDTQAGSDACSRAGLKTSDPATNRRNTGALAL